MTLVDQAGNGVAVAVRVSVAVRVAVLVRVAVRVLVRVLVADCLGLRVGVRVPVRVLVGVLDGVSVAVGDVVITSGQQQLRAGQTVQIEDVVEGFAIGAKQSGGKKANGSP